MNIHDLLTQGVDADESDDEDFQPDSSGSSDSEDLPSARNAEGALGAAGVEAMAAVYANLKESAKTVPPSTQLFPACQRLAVTAPLEVATLTKFVSSQPVAGEEREWRDRSANVPLPQVVGVLEEMDRDLNSVRVRRMRFAGKVYDVQVDPRTKQQKLATSSAGEVDEGIAEIQRALAGAKDVSAMTKSRADWYSYVKESDEAFQLRQHRKSSGAVLKKKMFLDNVAAAAAAPSGARRRRRAA